MHPLYSIFASVLIVFYFLLPFSSSQSICSLASTNSCVDDLDYLHCRLQEEIRALETLGGDDANVDSNQPLFSNAGRKKCEVFVKEGFCVSQPTEMTGYCCKTSARYCSDGVVPAPPPIDEEEMLFDDADDVDDPPVVNMDGIETTPIRALVTPTTTTTVAPITTNATVIVNEPSTLVPLPSPSNPQPSGPQTLCQFIDAAAAAASVAAESLKSFSFLFNSLAPPTVHQLAAEELLPSEEEEEEVVVEPPPTETTELTLQNSESDMSAQNSDSDMSAQNSDSDSSEDRAEIRNRRGSKILNKKQRQAAEEEIVIFNPPVEWNAKPITFGPNSRIKAPKRSARQKKMVRKIRQLQEEDGEDSELPDPSTDEDDEAPLDSTNDEVDLGILGIMGPDSSDLIASLLPKLHLKELNYTRVESTDIIGHGKEIAKILSNCNGCLLPIIEAVMDGAFQDEISADATSAEQQRVTEKNSEALVQMTAADFSTRAVKALERFIAEMATEHEAWLLSRQQSPTVDLTMEGFMQHSLNALKRVLKEDDLGGLMANLLSVIGVVTINMQDETKAQAFKASGEKIYSEVFGCSRDGINSATSEINSADKPSENVRRLMVRREGKSEGENSVEVQQDAGKGKNAKQQQLCNSKRQNEAAAEAKRQTARISRRQLQGESGAEEESNANNEVVEDDFLEGQPCLDRPVEFIASLQRLYSGLNCNDLISSISCAPERFLLPLETVVEACKLTWMQRCVEAPNGTVAATTSLDGLNNSAVAELLRDGQCVNREQEGVIEPEPTTTTTTTTPTATTMTSTSTSAAALRTTTSTTPTPTVTIPDNGQNKDSSAPAPSLFVVFVSVALSAIVSYY